MISEPPIRSLPIIARLIKGTVTSAIIGAGRMRKTSARNTASAISGVSGATSVTATARDIPVGQPLSPKEMEAWRDFFHKTFGTWPEAHWIVGGRRFSPWHQGIDSFNPFVASLLSKGGGLLPLYVLHLVAQQPRYGNEIMDLLAGARMGSGFPTRARSIRCWLAGARGVHQGRVGRSRQAHGARIYHYSSGQDEVTRIKTIVSPKVEETVTILQELLTDLQGQSSELRRARPRRANSAPMDKEIPT